MECLVCLPASILTWLFFQIGCCGLFIHPFFNHLFKAFVLIFWHLLEDRDITARVVRQSLMFYIGLSHLFANWPKLSAQLLFRSTSCVYKFGYVKQRFGQTIQSKWKVIWLQSRNPNMVRKRCTPLVVSICSLFWFGLTFWLLQKALSLRTTIALHATRVQSGHASRVASKCSEKKSTYPEAFDHYPWYRLRKNAWSLEFKIECLQSDTV